MMFNMLTPASNAQSILFLLASVIPLAPLCHAACCQAGTSLCNAFLHSILQGLELNRTLSCRHVVQAGNY